MGGAQETVHREIQVARTIDCRNAGLGQKDARSTAAAYSCPFARREVHDTGFLTLQRETVKSSCIRSRVKTVSSVSPARDHSTCCAVWPCTCHQAPESGRSDGAPSIVHRIEVDAAKSDCRERAVAITAVGLTSCVRLRTIATGLLAVSFKLWQLSDAMLYKRWGV